MSKANIPPQENNNPQHHKISIGFDPNIMLPGVISRNWKSFPSKMESVKAGDTITLDIDLSYFSMLASFAQEELIETLKKSGAVVKEVSFYKSENLYYRCQEAFFSELSNVTEKLLFRDIDLANEKYLLDGICSVNEATSPSGQTTDDVTFNAAYTADEEAVPLSGQTTDDEITCILF